MNAAVALYSPNSRDTESGRSHIFGPGTRINVAMPPADEDTAVLATLDAMSAIARRTAADPIVLEAVQAALAGAGSQPDRRGIAQAVWSYIRSKIRFVQDAELWPGAREVLIEPPRLLTMPDPSGDCDDFTMLAGALLLAAGVPVQFVVIAADKAEPDRFSHVYAVAEMESGELLPVDASHGPYAGWEAPVQFRRLSWNRLDPRDTTGDPDRGPTIWPYVAASAVVLLLVWRAA